MENTQTENSAAGGTSDLTVGLERPSMRCMICGLTAYARDPEMVKYGKSHYDCECGGHSFYPRAVARAL